MPLAKLHKTLQTVMGWEDTQKYTVRKPAGLAHFFSSCWATIPHLHRFRRVRLCARCGAFRAVVLLSHNHFPPADGVPIAKYNKDDIPCLSDSKIRLAYIVKDPGDEVC